MAWGGTRTEQNNVGGAQHPTSSISIILSRLYQVWWDINSCWMSRHLVSSHSASETFIGWKILASQITHILMPPFLDTYLLLWSPRLTSEGITFLWQGIFCVTKRSLEKCTSEISFELSNDKFPVKTEFISTGTISTLDIHLETFFIAFSFVLSGDWLYLLNLSHCNYCQIRPNRYDVFFVSAFPVEKRTE